MNSKIVFDTDCLSSFLCTGSEDILLKLYKDRIIIPDMVFKEFEKLKMEVGEERLNKIIAVLMQKQIQVLVN